MSSIYDHRIATIPKYPFETGRVPEHGIVNPISDLLGEYYRRISRFQSPTRAHLPPPLDEIVGWFGGKVTATDRARVEEDYSALRAQLAARRVDVSIALGGLFKAILLWSLLVDRGDLALADDPSVPMLAIFEAGYSVNQVSHGLEIWGEIPWTINPGDVLRRAGVWKD